MSRHRAEVNDWTRWIEGKREQEADKMFRSYGTRIMPAGPGKRRNEEEK